MARECNNTLTVGCSFISGSNAQGCMVVLVGEMENITVNLTRDGPSSVETVNTTFSFADFTQVVGFDIEYNGSVGTLAVQGKLLLNDSVTCMPKEREKDLFSSESSCMMLSQCHKYNITMPAL